MKKIWILFFICLIVGILIFIFNKKSNYIDVKKEWTENNLIIDNKMIEEKSNEKEKKDDKSKISSFSTKLPNDTEARDDNIKLACKTLSGTTVKKGEIFSLWDKLGCPTKEKGYKKAKTFTSDGKVTKSYGGGICQLSTTIYNAVLKVDGLKVIQRHRHSREVPYIKNGKDAAVSYDTADFKFKNNLDYDIKIEAKVKNREVKIELIRI